MEQWGVNACEDFGEIVFNLVEHGVFGKTETDQKQDPVVDAKTAAVPFEYVPVDPRLLRQDGRADRDQASGRKRLALDVHRQFRPAGLVD